MLSRMGGMDVEEVVETDPEAMRMLHVDPLVGFQDFQGRRLAFEIKDRRGREIRPVGAMLAKLYDVFVREDATLVEVNPLLITKKRDVVALDAKLTVDANALFRHPDIAEELRDVAGRGPAGADGQGARRVQLDGNIGILGNGAEDSSCRRSTSSPRPVGSGELPGRRRRLKAEAITSAVEVILSGREGERRALQHLRASPAATRWQGPHRGVPPDRARRAVRAPRRHERQGGPCPARRGETCRMSTRRRPCWAPPRGRGAGRLMSILVDGDTRLCVSGITGREGTFHSLHNRDYGTQVVAGVTPGKGGQDVEHSGLQHTFHDAVAEAGANTAMIFVPPRFAADSILEAEDAGIELVIAITEGIPAHDELKVYNHLRRGRTRLIGPNCPGILSPGKANVGIIPAQFFKEGNVGLVSRSGTLTCRSATSWRSAASATRRSSASAATLCPARAS